MHCAKWRVDVFLPSCMHAHLVYGSALTTYQTHLLDTATHCPHLTYTVLNFYALPMAQEYCHQHYPSTVTQLPAPAHCSQLEHPPTGRTHCRQCVQTGPTHYTLQTAHCPLPTLELCPRCYLLPPRARRPQFVHISLSNSAVHTARSSSTLPRLGQCY